MFAVSVEAEMEHYNHFFEVSAAYPFQPELITLLLQDVFIECEDRVSNRTLGVLPSSSLLPPFCSMVPLKK